MKKGEHHLRLLMYPGYLCVLYGSMGVDDVCLVSKLYVQVNVVMIVSACSTIS